MTGFFQTSFYFGYTLMFCLGLGIMCGAVGYLGPPSFVAFTATSSATQRGRQHAPWTLQSPKFCPILLLPFIALLPLILIRQNASWPSRWGMALERQDLFRDPISHEGSKLDGHSPTQPTPTTTPGTRAGQSTQKPL